MTVLCNAGKGQASRLASEPCIETARFAVNPTSDGTYGDVEVCATHLAPAVTRALDVSNGVIAVQVGMVNLHLDLWYLPGEPPSD